MKNTIIMIAFLLSLGQIELKADEYLIDSPECFTITNRERQTVIGHVETARHPKTGNRHRSEFRLEPGQSTKACTIGPFYNGYRVELVIKTFVPLFSCRTVVNKDIVILRAKNYRGDYKKDDRGYTIWADCY